MIRNVKNKPNTTDVDDMISHLADELLAHIVSFLPTKEAVATSILSKRWTHIFTLVTSLDFDDSPISYCVNNPTMIERASDFKSFVDNVLRRCESSSNITTFFSLKFGMEKRRLGHCDIIRATQCYPAFIHPMHLKSWICFPLSRGVRELHISTRLRSPGKLPFDLFRCRTLQVLKLDINFDLKLPKSFYLPNLKVFHLTLVRFPVGHFINRLLSKCLLLEDLALTADWETNHPIHITSAPSLRRLDINHMSTLDNYRSLHMSEFVLDAPKLEYLHYFDTMAIRRYSIVILKSLVEARISSYECDPTEYGSYEEILDLIRPLSQVRTLYLCERIIEALEGCRLEHCKMPMFHYLNRLELCFEFGRRCHKMLLELLIASPLLQTLVFWEMDAYGLDKVYDDLQEEIKNLSGTETTPSCLEFHLKRIEVKRLEGEDLDLALIEYFLRHASVLEELVITCTKMAMLDKMIFSRRLQRIPKRSPNCSIKVY